MSDPDGKHDMVILSLFKCRSDKWFGTYFGFKRYLDKIRMALVRSIRDLVECGLMQKDAEVVLLADAGFDLPASIDELKQRFPDVVPDKDGGYDMYDVMIRLDLGDLRPAVFMLANPRSVLEEATREISGMFADWDALEHHSVGVSTRTIFDETGRISSVKIFRECDKLVKLQYVASDQLSMIELSETTRDTYREYIVLTELQLVDPNTATRAESGQKGDAGPTAAILAPDERPREK